MNPNDSALHAGISGASLPLDEFDFGQGVILRKTYAHIMAPYLVAFAPAKKGQPHPAPWKAVSGGMGFDVLAELFIPQEFMLPNWFDRLNTVWWFVALLRLKASNLVTVPVLATKAFSEIPSASDEPYFWPAEMEPSRLFPVETPNIAIVESDLHWIREHWISGGQLMNTHDNFNVAFQAIDGCIWNRSPSLALVSLWGALERLFSPSPYELSFRVSATIASYIETSGNKRLDFFRHVKRLYDARSKAAHGSFLDESKSLFDTYTLLKRVLIKMIEHNHVPNRDELEASLFGEDLLS